MICDFYLTGRGGEHRPTRGRSPLHLTGVVLLTANISTLRSWSELPYIEELALLGCEVANPLSPILLPEHVVLILGC